MSAKQQFAGGVSSTTAWGATAIAGTAFAVLLTFAWVAPRMQNRLDDTANEAANIAANAEATSTPATTGHTGQGATAAAAGLDPAGPTITGSENRPFGNNNSMAWVLPELALPMTLATAWGVVLAWALLFKPDARDRAIRLAAHEAQAEGLRLSLQSAAAKIAEREDWVKRVEDDLVRVRGEMVALERDLITRLDEPPEPRRRRAGDQPQRRRYDDPDS